VLAAASAAVLVVALAASLPFALAGHSRPEAAPIVRDNTLVRIDPRTNSVRGVIAVSPDPQEVAAYGGRVWVYSRSRGVVSEVDATSNRVLHIASIRSTPVAYGGLTGPIIAADRHGAWVVGAGHGDRFRLTRVRRDGSRREYPVVGVPRAVAIGGHAVWVVTPGRLVRIDPASGAETVRARLPASADGLAFGLGYLWVTSHSTATLYRVDPRTGALASLDLGTRSARPAVEFGRIWVRLPDDTVLVDPQPLSIYSHLGCCHLTNDENVGGFGSPWVTDRANGALVRWNATTYQLDKVFQLTDAPYYDGSCLTSLAVASRAVWVTVAPAVGYACIG
jgi:streptogramin lyase